MSERSSSYPKNNSEQQINAAKEIEERGIKVVDRTYGSGYPAWKRGRCELSYHNGHHAREVGNTALQLCEAINLPKVETAVAHTAGYVHDLVQLKGRGIDEHESAQWLDRELAETGLFPPHMRTMATLAIKGTEPIFSNGQLVGQQATRQAYESKTARDLALSVASADLGELYAPQGPYLAHQLFREIQGMPRETELPFEKMVGFQRNQIGLLERYKYPLPEAERSLTKNRSKVIKYSHDVLKKLEKGTIGSWEELIGHDLSFIRRH